MPTKVLIVDDSGFFRRRLKDILSKDPAIQIVGEAANGAEAVSMAEKLSPDVITMDIEMPVMDGITAVRKIMAKNPTPTLMFSSLTYDGARATLDALDAGATDFLPKKFEEIHKDSAAINRTLQEKVKQLAAGKTALKQSVAASTFASPRVNYLGRSVAPAPGAAASTTTTSAVSLSKYHVVAIGTSTGGPVALQKVLTQLPASFSLPILVVQHMPGNFTTAFAERMNSLCKIQVKEAQDGDMIAPGVALLAPGGKQMEVVRDGRMKKVRVYDAMAADVYKPCVDVTFKSVAREYAGKALGIILTGMGADGAQGCLAMKQSGSNVWAQDEQSSLIYGMPAAVAKNGSAEKILPLDKIAQMLARG